jgi:GTP-dependent phosphoenolpyruvate carboxykinase
VTFANTDYIIYNVILNLQYVRNAACGKLEKMPIIFLVNIFLLDDGRFAEGGTGLDWVLHGIEELIVQ